MIVRFRIRTWQLLHYQKRLLFATERWETVNRGTPRSLTPSGSGALQTAPLPSFVINNGGVGGTDRDMSDPLRGEADHEVVRAHSVFHRSPPPRGFGAGDGATSPFRLCIGWMQEFAMRAHGGGSGLTRDRTRPRVTPCGEPSWGRSWLHGAPAAKLRQSSFLRQPQRRWRWPSGRAGSTRRASS